MIEQRWPEESKSFVLEMSSEILNSNNFCVLIILWIGPITSHKYNKEIWLIFGTGVTI